MNTQAMTDTIAPRRLTLSQIVEKLLDRSTSDRSTVTLTRNASGETQIDVKVRTGDDPETQTVEDCERRARQVYDRLVAAYPSYGGHDSSAVTLSRNAKGETQIELTTRTSDRGAALLEEAVSKAIAEYDELRMRYPMQSGYTAKPGSVA